MSNLILKKYKSIFTIEFIFLIIKLIVCIFFSILAIEYGYLFFTNNSIIMLMISIIHCMVGGYYYLSIKKSKKIMYNCNVEINNIKRSINYARY